MIIAFNKNDCECGNRSNKFVLKLVSGDYFAFYSSQHTLSRMNRSYYCNG